MKTRYLERDLWVMYGMSWVMYGMSWVMYGKLWVMYGADKSYPQDSRRAERAKALSLALIFVVGDVRKRRDRFSVGRDHPSTRGSSPPGTDVAPASTARRCM